jgi:hypothetical protein
MEYAIAFVISGLHQSIQVEKPFNPILGETFQGRYADGSEVYLEQTAHHPPISVSQLIGPEKSFVLSATFQPEVRFRGNSLYADMTNGTRPIISFKDGSSISYALPCLHVGSVIVGSRYIEFLGTINFVDKVNGLEAQVTIGPSTSGWFKNGCGSSDSIRGSLHVGKDNPSVLDEKNSKIIEGSWLSHLNIGGHEIWNIANSKQEFPQYPQHEALPSDSRHRPDCQQLREGNVEAAEKIKNHLENEQRMDKKLREYGKTKRERIKR